MVECTPGYLSNNIAEYIPEVPPNPVYSGTYVYLLPQQSVGKISPSTVHGSIEYSANQYLAWKCTVFSLLSLLTIDRSAGL